MTGRRQEKWVAVGSAVLKNIGLLMGKQAHGVGRLLRASPRTAWRTRPRPGSRRCRAEVADLEQQLAEATSIDPARFEETAGVAGARRRHSCFAKISSGCTDMTPAVPAAPAGRDAVRSDRSRDARGLELEGRLPGGTLVWPEGAPEWVALDEGARGTRGTGPGACASDPRAGTRSGPVATAKPAAAPKPVAAATPQPASAAAPKPAPRPAPSAATAAPAPAKAASAATARDGAPGRGAAPRCRATTR